MRHSAISRLDFVILRPPYEILSIQRSATTLIDDE
jgi:hypothetical protein